MRRRASLFALLATAHLAVLAPPVHRDGGGRVVVPPGEYLTGPIHLLGNVDLHVAAGATVRFSRDPAKYLPPVLTRWEGVAEIGEVGSAIDIDLLYEEGARGPFEPTVRNVRVERMTVGKAVHAFFVRGLPRAPVRGLVVADSVFRGVVRASRIQDLEELSLRNVVLEPAR